MNTSHIERAVAHAGSQKRLAAACGLTQAAVSKWVKGGGISPESARLVEIGTKGVVTAKQLRPDIFDPPSTDHPKESPAPAERAA